MTQNSISKIPETLQKHQRELLEAWLSEQLAASTQRLDLITEAELRRQSEQFLNLLRQATQQGELADTASADWQTLREWLADLSRSRAQLGFSASETASFILSLKQVLFQHLRQKFGDDNQALADDIWQASALLDRLGLYTTEVYQKSREDIVQRQQQELLELSTPVVKLWDGIVAVPLIGTLDSARTQVVMESLLQKIVETGSSVAIVDITGVPIVDTLVAQYLLKTVAAARLMGAECIISGIRPQIAQTIVHLGINLSDVVTKADLSSAFVLALQRTGFLVTPVRPRGEV
jgi:rsbT co-antagonist protein RsbR